METTQPNFQVLKDRYGSHSEAARRLGLSIRHYAKIRKGEAAHPMTMRVIREEIERAEGEDNVRT